VPEVARKYGVSDQPPAIGASISAGWTRLMRVAAPGARALPAAQQGFVARVAESGGVPEGARPAGAWGWKSVEGGRSNT
jgi:hypothetical protein